MDKETSDRVSSLAGHLLNRKRLPDSNNEMVSAQSYNILLDQAQTVAGSALVQDEPEPPKKPTGIHPAPAEFTEAEVAADPVLHYFHYSHLPPTLQETSRAFFEVAYRLVKSVPRNAERTVALRKLLEAKDAAVRANLPAPKLDKPRFEDGKRAALGEPVEIGGHNEDRDGPIPFDS